MCDAKSHVRFGSADILMLQHDVRFTAESGHSAVQMECPLWSAPRWSCGKAGKAQIFLPIADLAGNPGLILTSPPNLGLRNLADPGIVDDERVATSPGSGDSLCWCLSRPRYCGGGAGGRCKAKPYQD